MNDPYIVARIDGEWWVLKRKRRDSDSRHIISTDFYYVRHANTGGDEQTAFDIAQTLNDAYYANANDAYHGSEG